MVKCGGCGKFLAASAGVRCTRCSATFHRSCVGLPDGFSVGSGWTCSGCTGALRTPAKASLCNTEAPVSPARARLDMSSLDVTDDNPDLLHEIRVMRKEISALRAEVRESRMEFSSALKACNEAIHNLDSRISVLENRDITSVDDSPPESAIAELKCQLNERDQELLLNDIEISGMPEHSGESAMHIVKVLSAKLGTELDDRDIVHVERVGSTRRNRTEDVTGTTSADPTTQRPRNITVRFARRATRDSVLRAARVRRGITSADVQVAGPPRRVYVNERLTPVNKRLFYHTKQAAQQQQWKYVWTRQGKVMARKDEGKLAERVRSDKDITKIFGITLV